MKECYYYFYSYVYANGVVSPFARRASGDLWVGGRLTHDGVAECACNLFN